MAKVVIPRGITVVQWVNKSEKGTQIRYRVRINREGFKANKLFEDLDEAKTFLTSTKTKDGRLGLTERERLDDFVKMAFKETLENPKFSEYANKYIKKYVKPTSEHPTKQRSYKTNLNRIENILAVVLPMKTGELATTGGMNNIHPSLAKFAKNGSVVQKKLGDFLIAQIDVEVANAFIEKRLEKGLAKSTVKREVGQLQSIFNKLVHIDKTAPKKFADGANPFELCDKSVLEGHNKKRKRRLTVEEERRLMGILATRRNPAMLQISALALATGMRRGEVLFLTWDNVKDGYLEVENGKSGDRLTSLSEEAKTIIKAIKKRDNNPRLFPYTADGFKTNFKRCLVAAGVDNYHFHDFRREHISRMVQLLGNPSATLIAELTGMRSVRHINDEYIDPLKRELQAKKGVITNIDELMKSVGHTKESMLYHYTNLNPTKS